MTTDIAKITELKARIAELEECLNDLWEHYATCDEESFEDRYPEHSNTLNSVKPEIKTTK